MSTITINGSTLGSALTDILLADDIVPGASPSYSLCKTIYSFHVLGQKMVDKPITASQYLPREIAVPGPAEEEVVRAFQDEWKAINTDKVIAQTARIARIYGVGSVACLDVEKEEAVDTDKPIEFDKIADKDITFNVFDPLNTAGSLVLSQIPTQADFIKARNIRVQSERVHRSRSCVIMNGDPIYLEYTTSAFGYVGRSVYQPALFPLKSFIQTMFADDMVATKVGVLIAKLKQPGSIADQLMAGALGIKRNVVKESKTYNVINITPEEAIESINLQNMQGPYEQSRKNILENIAAADDMPAVMLNSESLAQGFADGTEDAKRIAQYVDEKRKWMQPLYDFMTKIVQYRAWNKDFVTALQNKYPDLKQYTHTQLVQEWRHNFIATWPSLISEPESELLRGEELILRAAIQAFEVLYPAVQADPEQSAKLVMWLSDQFNQRKKLFTSPLNFDLDMLASALEQKLLQAPQPGDNPDVPTAPGATKGDSIPRSLLRQSVADSAAARDGINEILRTLSQRQRPKAVA